MVIYADLLMLLNFLVDFLLLMGTNRLSGYPPDSGRAALAALLGALYCGACFTSGFAFLSSFLWRLVCLALMAGIAFGWNRSTAARGALFTLLSMALGGIATGMGKGGFLVLVSAAAAVWLLCRLSFRGDAGTRKYLPMRLQHGGKTVQIVEAIYRAAKTGEKVTLNCDIDFDENGYEVKPIKISEKRKEQ